MARSSELGSMVRYDGILFTTVLPVVFILPPAIFDSNSSDTGIEYCKSWRNRGTDVVSVASETHLLGKSDKGSNSGISSSGIRSNSSSSNIR